MALIHRSFYFCRLKDSMKHVDQMEKMLCMLEELQHIKRAADQKLQETEDETLALNRKVETLELVIKDLYSSLLSHEKQCGDNTITSSENASGSSQAAKPANDFKNKGDELQEKVDLVSTRHWFWMIISVRQTVSSVVPDCFLLFYSRQ